MNERDVQALCNGIRLSIQSATQLSSCPTLEALIKELDLLFQTVPADAGGTLQATWASLDSAAREALVAKLETARMRLDALIASRRCADSGPLMSERCVPTGWIVVLALMAIFGIFAELYMIRGRWDKSMQGGALAEERQAALSVATENAKSAKEETQRRRRALTDAQALAKARPPAGSAEAAPEAQAAPDLAVLEAARRDAEEREKESWRDVIEIKKTMGPGPNDVLIMVILLGGMGGFLHMATSLTMYIGNRELYRSWIVYYLLAPFQGAALAVIMYLLVTATVLQLPLGPGAGPVGLNLTGVYGFSALTGLFAKQAIEKLKDVFSMLLTSIVAKDGVVPKS